MNHVLEYAARWDIRPIIVRQERVGLHIADALSRLSSGRKIGVFAMQHGPGAENAYGGVAQAFGEGVPLLVLPMGYARHLAHIRPNFNSNTAMSHIAKSTEPITSANDIANVMRRAFASLRTGRGGPVVVEIPNDIINEEMTVDLVYSPVSGTRYGPDSSDVDKAAKLLLDAKTPVIYAGQGIHYAKAWPQLLNLAELLGIPVCTSLGGKSAFPEDHPLSLGTAGLAYPKTVYDYLHQADLIFGIGCSFTETSFGIKMPKGKTVIHATLDPIDLNKDVEIELGILGDAELILNALLEALNNKIDSPRKHEEITNKIASIHEGWLSNWLPKLTSNSTPLNPYRVLWDLQKTVNKDTTIITHDAGSPRDQLSPFWRATKPLSYIGWGKTTQLGYGLGLAMGAKIARPEALCINVWGDAAIGFTGMDFETCVREDIPILSILLNNFSMAIELKVMPVSTEKYRATDISGNYADMARAFGGYGERVTQPSEIIPAIKRGILKTESGVPALLEFITEKEVEISRF